MQLSATATVFCFITRYMPTTSSIAFAMGGVHMVAQGHLDFVAQFRQKCFGFFITRRSARKMNLNAARRGQDGGDGVLIFLVQGGDALVHFRFRQAHHFVHAARESSAHPRAAPDEPGSADSKTASSSLGGPGRRITMVPLCSSQMPGAVPFLFSSQTAPSGTIAWRTLFSDMARPTLRESLLNLLANLRNFMQRPPEDIGHHIAVDVVLSGAKAPDQNDQFGASRWRCEKPLSGARGHRPRSS